MAGTSVTFPFTVTLSSAADHRVLAVPMALAGDKALSPLQEPARALWTYWCHLEEQDYL